MVAVLAVVAEEEVLGRGVVEDGVAHLLVVEAVGQVEGYPVVVHVFQQGQHVPVAIEHQFLVVLLDQFREDKGVGVDVDAEGVVCHFGGEKHLCVYFVHVVYFHYLVVVLVEGGGVEEEAAFLVEFQGRGLLNR